MASALKKLPQGSMMRRKLEPLVLRENRTAVKALFPLVRMPQSQHGSGKAIKHWRGSCSSPLDQNLRIGQPGLSWSKRGHQDAEKTREKQTNGQRKGNRKDNQ